MEGFIQIDDISLLEKDDLHSSDITRKIAAITNFEEKTVLHTTFHGFNSYQPLLVKVSIEITTYGRTVDFKVGQYEFLAIGCPAGRYGAPCEFDCVCMNGATCHVFNGACLCTLGWQGPACDIPSTATSEISSEDGHFLHLYQALNLLCHARGSDGCDDILWFHNGREIKPYLELGVIQSRSTLQCSYSLSINNLSRNHSGTYQCIVRQQEPGNVVSIPSNVINITVSGCEPGTWGPHCQYLCQCIHSTNCTQYEGCVCEEGWDGDQCQTDIENPKISCPHDTTFLLEEHDAEALIEWSLPEISDNSNSVNTTSNYSPGDRMSTGKHLITYTAIDISGNTATCSFMLNIKDQSAKIPWFLYGLMIGFFALTMIALLTMAVITKRRGRRYGNYTRMETPKFVVPENVDSYARSDVTITTKTLGCGQFANVYIGEINICDNNPLAVAVKKMKGADGDYIRAFENEVKSLNNLKDSDHIVTLIGVLIDEDIAYILTELMSCDLKGYLVGRCFENERVMREIADNLTDIALHVVRALQDMATKMIIHRDIAARNVLLYVSSKGVVAKLGDFGLGRQVYMTGKYRESVMESKYLPLAWMSLESLTEGVYTHKSDIWSYGILLWEMATLGGVPYSEIEHLNSRVLIKHLQLENNRLHKPRHCPEIMYSIMTSCWKANPNDRPDSNNIEKDILQCAKDKMGFFCDDEPREIGATWV
ncbi:insulin-like growth factor 1 receptor [Glandiceps talaboti]